MTDAWTVKAPMPTARSVARSEVIDGILHVVGGGVGDGSTIYTTVHAYDPLTDSWITRAGIMPERQAFTSAVIDGDLLFVLGGTDSSAPLPPVDFYDPAADTWTRISSNMPTPRGFLGSGVVGEEIYTIGGSDQLGGPPLATVEAFDAGTGAWSSRPSMNVARQELATAVVNGVIYAIGGIGAAYGSLAVVEAFTPAPPMPSTRDECRNEGWRSFGVFKNQGDCISYAVTHGGNPPSGG